MRELEEDMPDLGLCDAEWATGKLPNHQTTVEGRMMSGRMMSGPREASWLKQFPELPLTRPSSQGKESVTH